MRPSPAIQRSSIPIGRRAGKLLRYLILLLLAAFVCCAAVSTYIGWQLTHPAKKLLNDSPDRYGLSFEPVQFESRNKDITLHGWFLPAASSSESAKMNVIMAHGYRENRLQAGAEALKLAKTLVGQGYNVLMFDFRNSGESDGKLTTVGYLETSDLLGAVDWTRSRHPGKIALHGFSMGATSALLAAAEDSDIAGVIADSPFNHLTNYLKENLPVWSHLPQIPFTPLILGILPPLTGIDTDKVDGLAAVDRIYPRPILFIHAGADPSIPFANSRSMWEKHPDKFRLWAAPGAGHASSHASAAIDYETQVIEFLNQL